MDALFFLENRYNRTPDGAIWTPAQFDYEFWKRHLTNFERVRVAARVQDVETKPEKWLRADGELVSFVPIPYYIGPLQFARKRATIVRAAQDAITGQEVVVMHVPSTIAFSAIPKLRGLNHPFAVSVVADPYNNFAPGVFHHPLRPFFRWHLTRQLKNVCQQASAAIYVTQYALQKRYPAGVDAITIGCSDVELTDGAYVDSPRYYTEKPVHPKLIVVGSLESHVKGIDILLEAVALSMRQGIDLHLTIVGDGRQQSTLEQQAKALNIVESVEFVGQLPGAKAVRQYLDRSDLFVLPSRSEGMPRAVIEAMARGLPCIGTNMAGIPELLASEDLVPINDAEALANNICQAVQNPIRLSSMAQRNLEKSREYHLNILQRKRQDFFQGIRELTEEWLAKKNKDVLQLA